MGLVMLALVPATLFDFWLFGWPAIFLFALTVGACVGIEALCLRLAGKGSASISPTALPCSPAGCWR